MSQIIGTNQVSTDAARMPRLDQDDRTGACADHHASDPEQEQQDEQRLAHAARDAQIPRGQVRVAATTVESAEAEVRDGRREERLADVREADRAG